MSSRLFSILFLALLLSSVWGRPARVAEVSEPVYCLAEDWPNLPAGRALGQAAGLAVDSRDVVYVFHRGQGDWPSQTWLPAWLDRLFTGTARRDPIAQDTILAIDPQSGALLSAFGAERFLIPHGLSMDAEDNLWVTDVGLHQVFKLAKDGTVLLTLGVAGVPGRDRTHFNGPTDVAVARDGSVYVADGYGNARVVKYSKDGTYLFEWGVRGTEPGQFDLPHGIAIDASGNLYVADRGNARIQVFDGEGRVLRQIAGPEIGRPWALDIADDGYLYAIDGGDQDPANPRSGLLVLTLEGQVIARWSRYGHEPGNLVWPHDLAVSRRAEVFVGEVLDGKRIQKFRPDCGTGMG